MQTITVLFFATLHDRAGTRSMTLDIPAETSVARLWALLKEKIVTLDGLVERSLVSVIQEYVFDEQIILARAEVALFPPVSGG